MKITKLCLGLLCLILCIIETNAQNNQQTIRGTVIDAESRTPLIGVNLILLNNTDGLGSSTDLEGNFRIEGVPYGRHDIQVSYLSYESKTITRRFCSIWK